MAAKRFLLVLSALALLGGLLAGCPAKDEAKEAYKGPGQTKAGAPVGASMDTGGAKAAPPKAGGLGLEAPAPK